MNYELKNYMEIIVEPVVAELILENNVCECKRCKLDILALSLNQLAPKYVVTRSGELMTEIDATQVQSRADVLSSVLRAINIVKRNPSCDRSKSINNTRNH